MPTGRAVLVCAGLLLAGVLPAAAQKPGLKPDSARGEIVAVLRAFYFNLENGNWDALAGYVLSPKLLERRGAPGDSQAVAKDRGRPRAPSPVAAEPVRCSSSTAPMLDRATIQVDGDWADVWVPRCRGMAAGTDEFGMLYFEQRWRFIYTDLFEAPSDVSASR